ncbi:MAG: DUF5689 domain-containing protein [Flavobacteriales bacterium]|nr:DUF5689 domain-containing protein [Flavobacteriales bacterium]MCW8912485.1 DUF5689 domain-containing protein [Flavobacteriales bacterium]MCW8936569.1 DUF5689 domain-containing protein [Flavobacteriales bacterium]MCW8940942.1 DUF5689 domain-containing protein [Flavobacteriales bacterium]MCW8989625.1 DUF5689 domain-containing protein [Flavobacteriales bacterium]
MTITKKITGILLLAGISLFSVGCKKDFDTPPIKTIPEGNRITIADLKAMYQNTPLKITDELSLFAVVTMDEQSGNIYKEAYIQDETGAINLRLLSSGGLYQGDSVRVFLKGTILNMYRKMMQLDSVDVDNNIIKQATKKDRQPDVLTSIANIDTVFHQGKLIKFENVQFSSSELGNTYADGINLLAKSRTLEDAFGKTIIVRTSGYANFANDTLPNGKGSLIAIVSQYDETLQLLIRNPNEVILNNPRSGLAKNFQDESITSGGWTTQLVTGTYNWTTSDAGSTGNFYGMMSNWTGSGNVASEAWLISPAIDLSASTNATFDFRNASNFSGPNMEVLVSTNYDGVSAPSTATWTQLGANLSTGGFAWVNGGPLSLNSYLTNGVYLAFKYTGTASSGKTWEVDDIIVTW